MKHDLDPFRRHLADATAGIPSGYFLWLMQKGERLPRRIWRKLLYKPPGSYTITLILPNTPSVDLGSPAGILTPDGSSLVQSQNINGTVGQWVTYGASSPALVHLNIAASGCGTSCAALPGGLASSPPYMWLWNGSASPPGDTYATITATDNAGNTNTTVPVSTSAFSLFTPGSNGLSLTCDAASGNCSTLADQADNDIPGDPPSPTVGQCAPPHNTYLFSGYGDPSMRAEQLVPDSDGVDLWLLYSYPSYNWSVPSPSCSNTTTVETHLAGSIANSGPNGGASWIAYCGGVACSGPSGPATPIFPSEPYCSGTITPINGHTYTCQSVCNEGPVVGGQQQSTWSTCFSSHEVPNFWPYVNTSANPATETWFGVHLMYFVGQGTGIGISSIANGCLVVSMADSPSNLGWSLGSGPNTCLGTFPSGSQALLFSALTTLTGQSCNSWGEPAIMVAAAPSGSGNAIYLAASCINIYGASNGYYIFNSQSFTTPPVDTTWAWSTYAGPFKYSDIPLGTITPMPGQPVNSLTEFDWAMRADGSTIGIVTPMYVDQPGYTNQNNFQYGCLALNFYLQNPTALFGSVVATLNDTDQGSPYDESYGSNGCTYEPMSNTGVLIGRRLVDIDYTTPSQYETYALINTGVLP